MGDAGEHPAILISNRQTAPLDEPGLTSLARETLRGEDMARSELSVSFVEDEEMAELHSRYMGEDGPTDVLSFPQDEQDEDGVRVLGDVVIAPAVAARNNPDHTQDEVRLLLVHGILHLLGYDHEAAEERVRMWARQEHYSGVKVP